MLPTIDAAFALLPDDEELLNIKKEIDEQSGIHLELKQLEEDPSIDGRLAEMLDFELHMCDNQFCLECKMSQLFFEMDVIMEIESFRKDVLRLKNSYPKLYNMKKDFFDNILNRKKEDYLLASYHKKLKKYRKLYPQMFELGDDEEEYLKQQPYKRPEPKVGRNDPCPYGSGKKYKKCCGRA